MLQLFFFTFWSCESMHLNVQKIVQFSIVVLMGHFVPRLLDFFKVKTKNLCYLMLRIHTSRHMISWKKKDWQNSRHQLLKCSNISRISSHELLPNKHSRLTIYSYLCVDKICLFFHAHSSQSLCIFKIFIIYFILLFLDEPFIPIYLYEIKYLFCYL